MIAIAIDGPAGAGKSTIARMCAMELGYIYVDTGALYRTVGIEAKRMGINVNDEKDCNKLLSEIKIDLTFQDGFQIVLLNGEDVSEEIRTPEASMMASAVSAVPKVREFLLDLQKNMAEKYNVLMDGRDIATVVLPNADVKIFLTASPEIRAKRRYDELSEKGDCLQSYENVLEDIIKRDYADSHRKIAPLIPAKDSIVLDTSSLTLEQAKDKLLEIIHNKLGSKVHVKKA